jgi:hypothetical protein
VTRRKDKKLKQQTTTFRKARIDKLIAAGWISTGAEIPSDAIPVDPELINLGWSSNDRPTYYRAVQFICSDCGTPQTWKAEDQRWYYEDTGASYDSKATRCRSCRKKEQSRKTLARISAGHVKPKV